MLECHRLTCRNGLDMRGPIILACCMALGMRGVSLAEESAGVPGDGSGQSDHWAFQPIQKPPIPATRFTERIRNPIDSFVFGRLDSEGLVPRPTADQLTLHRRVSLDLLGLPPSPAEQRRFAQDTRPGAWERLVARLLVRPEFGERWARHWLDVARYGESNGYERDGSKPNAWRFRDYVIAAFNDDLPFDRFLAEQLAGDEVEGSDARSQIATTFLRLGTWDDEPADPFADRFDQLDDILATTASAFLGITLRCARCHDHKFEPLSQEDYYGILAVFTPLKRPEKIKSATHREEFDREVGTPAELAAYRAGVKKCDQTLDQLKNQQATLISRVRARVLKAAAGGDDPKISSEIARAFLADAKTLNDQQKDLVKKNAKKVEQHVSESYSESERDERLRLAAEIAAVAATRPAQPTRAYIWYEDTPKAGQTRLFERGDPYQPKRVVSPNVPAVLRSGTLPAPKPLKTSTGRRLWLARWMTSRANPLVARVFVNRVWQHLLGEGLVTTESNFGEMGDVPFHQDLLDWLAADLVDSGWKIKRLLQQIVTSAVYRMDSRTEVQSAMADPQERLLWRFRQRRLDAEAFRDSVLAVTGQLNRTMRGPSVYPTLPGAVLAGQSRPGSGWGKAVAQSEGRRSVYIFSKRSLAVPELALLDAPNSADSCSQRAVSTTGPQALTFLNGAFMTSRAAAFAKRLVAEAGPRRQDQVELAFRLAMCRRPSADEIQLSIAFLSGQAKLPTRGKQPDSDPARRALKALCLVLLNTNEFAYTR